MLTRTEIEQLLGSDGPGPRRSLGQNFVADPSVVQRIAEAAGVGPGDVTVEIGPGLGSLSLALAATGTSVLAIEKDRRMIPVLTAVLAARDVLQAGPGLGPGTVAVEEGDALEIDWTSLLARRGAAGRPVRVVANLPYNVAVPIIMSVLESAPMVDRMVVMVQREVAERLVAGPGGRTVGIPSMRVAWYAQGWIDHEVAAEAFVPRPKVTSAVVVLRRRPPPAPDLAPAEVFGLVETAYRHRRKMLRSTLGGTVDADAFDAAGIAPTRRPEELSIREWTDLARAVRR